MHQHHTPFQEVLEPETATVTQFNFFNQKLYYLQPISWSRLPLLPRCHWSNNISYVENNEFLPEALAHALNPSHHFEYIKTPMHLFDIFASLYGTPQEFRDSHTPGVNMIHSVTLRMASAPEPDYFGYKAFTIALATLAFSRGGYEFEFTLGQVEGDDQHPVHGTVPTILIGWGAPVVASSEVNG